MHEGDRRIARGNFSDVGRRGVSPSGGIQKASRALSLLHFFPLAPSLSLYHRSSPIVTKSHVDSFFPLSYHRDATEVAWWRLPFLTVPSFINYRAIYLPFSLFLIFRPRFDSVTIKGLPAGPSYFGDSRRLSVEPYTGGNIMRKDDFR